MAFKRYLKRGVYLLAFVSVTALLGFSLTSPTVFDVGSILPGRHSSMGDATTPEAQRDPWRKRTARRARHPHPFNLFLSSSSPPQHKDEHEASSSQKKISGKDWPHRLNRNHHGQETKRGELSHKQHNHKNEEEITFSNRKHQRSYPHKPKYKLSNSLEKNKVGVNETEIEGKGLVSKAISSDDKVGQRFKERLERVHRACRLYYNASSLYRPKRAGFERMPVYPSMNVSVRYCPIAKTSATTWSYYFYDVRTYMQKRGERGSENRTNVQDEIYFTFVREPYTRMLSGYVDKLLTPNAIFWKITGKFIVRRFRKMPQHKSMWCGHDVTFPEFVKFVVYSQYTGYRLNGHFIPTHDQCDMCTLPYRYIGHLETIREDMPYIIKAIHSPLNYTKSYDTDTIIQNAKMILWSDRPLAVKKCMDLDEASRRLWKKYQIRGIISKHQKFPYSRGAAINITFDEFTKVALEAHERSKNDPHLKAQRVEALKEAFASVPLTDRLNAQATLFLDFEMFGFDPFKEEVFPRTPYINDENFSYFKIFDD